MRRALKRRARPCHCPVRKSATLRLFSCTASNLARLPAPIGDWALDPSQMRGG